MRPPLKKGDRVVWTLFPGMRAPRYGTVNRDHDGGSCLYVNWDGDGVLNPAASAAHYCELLDAPVASEWLCSWIVRRLLTEDQLDAVPPHTGRSLRFMREPD